MTKKKISSQDRLIVALDVPTKYEAIALCQELQGRVSLFKIGLGLFLGEGRNIIDAVRHLGGRVFLDLKLHDIPYQVANASRSIVKMGVEMLTIHTSGGLEMMKECVKVVREEATRLSISPPMVLGVTILTSLDKKALEGLGITTSLEEITVNQASLAKQAGLDGIVASVHEINLIREVVGKELAIVTPGIRLPGEKAEDQKRIATPAEAFRLGANYIVVGRPVSKSPNPAGEVDKIMEEVGETGDRGAGKKAT